MNNLSLTEFSVPESLATDQWLMRRQTEALTAAQRCITRLISHYGARHVIVCGSTVNASPWHRASDLDLAVEGLSAEALEHAAEDLLELLPDWLTVDLIPLERVVPEVRHRLLENTMPEASLFVTLKIRLQDELVALRRVQRGLAAAVTRVQGEPLDEFTARALATYVEDFYTGCERISERIAVTLDGGLPEGRDWHRALLGQMADPGGYNRPALFSGNLLLELDEFRRFRHRVRHIYGYELDPDRVFILAQATETTFMAVQAAVEHFTQWLEQQNTDNVN